MVDPRRIAKVYGEPAAMAAGEAAAQMTPASPFGPGAPIRPYDGYSRTPRTQQFVPGYNINARPRSHERISFETLKGLITAYDVAQMCIWHRIDSIRSLDWSLVAAPHFDGDVTDAIRTGMAVLRRPDRQTPFATWLSGWLYDILAYDAGALYRLRNRRGNVIGLLGVDGTTIAPLLDYWGRPPAAIAPGEPEPEAYVQYVNGLSWNWLTLSDLIYQPFRKKHDSPYGLAPLETILLTANTDLRFQQYFLQRFTEGNIPEAFASSPDTWAPDQIEQWQTYWDSFMAGDQAAKHTIKWIPGGSSIAWSNERDFTDAFSLFLMRKTAAAYHVVPSDLGFTETVNLSSSESQADVQHRVGDLPLIRHVQQILSAFLQDDLGLPLDFAFDLGEEQADRLQQAQADQIYLQMGVIGGSDIREMRYGLAEPEGRPMPRFIFTERSGPIPLSALYSVAGQIDPATAAPQPGVPLPRTAFTAIEGVLPNPPLLTEPLAEQEYGPSALPPAPPPQPGAPVTKEGAPTAGITAETGITGYDLVDQDEDEEDEEQLAKAELAAFRKFRKARQRADKWRDFEFRHIGPLVAAELNRGGRSGIAKAETTAPKGDAPAKGASRWPGWEADLTAANYWAPLITAAQAGALSASRARQLAAGYLAQQPRPDGDADKEALTAAAAAWLATQGPDLAAPLTAVLPGLYTDGYLVGLTSAQALLSGKRAQRGAWQPGDTTAARDVIDRAGAGDGIANTVALAPDAAQGVAAARQQDMARALVDGLLDGATADDIGGSLTTVLTDPGKALTVAISEITRASGTAAQAVYQQDSVAQVRWLSEEDDRVCTDCLGQEAAGPRPIDAGPMPPLHPRCRCALIPA